MKISRIRIEQLRRFRQPIEIAGLSDGINLFVGPNEAGKSTIAQAIRAAFFERHRSSSVEHLRPWGDSSAAPSVDIEFEIDGRPARLRKRFLQRKRCELELGGRKLEGVEAEDELAALLGFGFAGKGRSGAEHWGIPGLLWVEQGGAQDLDEAVGHAGEHLQRALGGVASSTGDAVLEQVEGERNKLLTEGRGTPRGDYADAVRREVELAQRCAQLDTQVEQYRDRVDQLEELRRAHARDEAARPWLEQREQEQQARTRLAQADRMRQQLDETAQQLQQAERQHALYGDQLRGFEAQAAQLETRRADLQAAELRLQAADHALAAARAAQQQAQQASDAARALLGQVREQQQRRELAARVDELAAQATRTRGLLAQAEGAQQALLHAQREAAATEIGERDLVLLREQRNRQRELLARQQSVATRLRYQLEPGRVLELGGLPISGDGEALLVSPTRLSLPGLGSLELTPGGGDLAGLARELDELGGAHDAALRRVGASSLDDAEARLHKHRELRSECKAHESALRLLVPQGVEALRSELAGLEARLQSQTASLAALPAAASAAPQVAALPEVAQAQAAEEAAREQLARCSDELSRRNAAAMQARAEEDAARRELHALQASLSAPDRAERVRRAQEGLTECSAQIAVQRRRSDELRAAIEQVRPELLEQDVRRCAASAEALEREFAERRVRIAGIASELETLGAQGLDEARAEARRELETCRRRLDELARRARALDHLLQRLRASRAALTQRLHAPLQRHLDRYVQMLFPQARLELGEDFAPRLLARPGGEAGDVHDLSFGAREQMGVISRLAYADLLRESGRPTLILLDDVLVHSDEQRLQQMKRVLFDAAGRHQVLLFSCHPEKWRDLGVRPRSLSELGPPA